MKAKFQSGLLLAVAVSALSLVGCGGVSGVYQAEGGAISIEFQSGGKANFTMGPMKQACTYTETSTTVAITCDGQTINFTIKGNQLMPPSDSIFGPLTKK